MQFSFEIKKEIVPLHQKIKEDKYSYIYYAIGQDSYNFFIGCKM